MNSKMENIKLVVTDLDGTVLDHGKFSNPEDLPTLLELEKQGIGLTIATGQSWSNAVIKAKWFEIDKGLNYIICNNGAYISKVTEYDPIYISKIDDKIVQKIYDKTTAMNITFFAFYKKNQHLYWNGLPLRVKSLNDRNWTDKYFLDDISNEKNFNYDDVMQIMIFVPENQQKEFEQWFKDEKLDQVLLSMENNIESTPIYEFTNITANKGTAVKNLANLLNININNVVTFGDNLNDMGMIKDVPNSVAMGNAVAEIKKQAKYVTDTNKNGGVGQFIRNNILKGE